MAPRSPLSTVPNTPLLNGQQFHNVANTVEQTTSPSGGCNFTVLSAAGGGTAPRCGCRRYYDKPPVDSDGRVLVGKSGYCMCEHHACFHDHDAQAGHSSRVSNGQVSIRSTTPKQQDNSAAERLAELRKLGGGGSGPGTLRDSQLPETLHWSRFIHSGSPEALPAIPSQCLLPSDNGSGTSSSQSRYHQPFGGMGLNTLSHIPNRTAVDASKSRKSPLGENFRAMQVYEDHNGQSFLQSITEVATPSLHASQDDSALSQNIAEVQNALEKLTEVRPESAGSSKPFVKKNSDSQVLVKQSSSHPPIESTTIAPESDDYLIPRLKSILARVSSFPSAVENHERRLDRLENTSFTNPVVEDLQEGHNVMDTRVADLENRLLDLENAQKILNDGSSVSSRHVVEGSFISTTSSAMISAAIDQIDPSRIEALEDHVAELRACAPPSHNRPWEVEVVFVPFGSDLPGVWSSQPPSAQRSRFREESCADDNWTQTQNQSLAAIQASLAAHEHTSAWERSTDDLATEESVDWLTAKACGRGSRIDERLRSRGLVRTINVKGPDARDVQAAIMQAFGEVPGLLVEDPFTTHENDETNTIPSSLSHYLGLQASWIPLRKLHKNSSLQFLNTSEMVTPALWTVQFLASSVAMRTSGLRRLYVTQRDSYIQHHGDVADWSWQKLRQLPRVYSDESSQDHTPEADAHEPCWEFDERLDPAPMSVHSSFHSSSFESQVSSLSIRSLRFEEEPVSPSDHFSSAEASPHPSRAPTPRVPIPTRMLSPVVERNPFRPMHMRTLSMPSLVPLKSPAPSAKRRITSFEQEAQSSPIIAASTSSSSVALKRRRVSRSPSRSGDTPLWGIGPPSPQLASEETSSKRPTTPFAYATPHSNAPYVDTRPHQGEDIEIWQDDDDEGSATNELSDAAPESEDWEQNALSDFEPDKGATNDVAHDEWRGVDDGMGYDSRPAAGFRVGPLTPRVDEDLDGAFSDASEVPSEYPSTQQGLGLDLYSKAGFRIHVDEEGVEL
ncbi:hypothetical protein GLAREA_04339 [Glarea lozoyensis ATCC 20868]|uniref:Uncharacterized protein n=1 Tax=Glarea lozoyensis (strain ATCC 20868 / MF5171) TaxID=1116229 RepID=S3DLZ1_GLAL2|nr:uncharacterized protein GLAREA_04339 [Glarea lozoyensis ATCC 20868]EPE27548.1 hypothetical protein GLAREA_04339 [Glarea lozoyensis ATCC 20868]